MKIRSTFSVSLVSGLALTLFVCLGFYLLNSPTGAARLIDGMPSEPAQASAFLLETASDMTGADMSALAREVAAKNDVETTRQIVEKMIHTKGYKGPLAVLIAENGAAQYNDPGMLNRAGLEYSAGRFVKRDYLKAKTYLSNPALARSMISQFYLAEVLLAPDNPKRDPERGRKLLKLAADAGIEAAKKRLAQ